MIIKSFTTDFTVDETAERLADKRHDVPTEIVTCGRTIEGQIDIRDCRASAVNHLEQPVSTDAAGGSESLIEQLAPARATLQRLLPSELQLARSFLPKHFKQGTGLLK